MRKSGLMLLGMLGICSLSYAGFFSNPVQFFGSTRTETKPLQSGKIQNKPRVSIWAQPIIMPDGSIRIYVPPMQVISFLNNPTHLNAKEYLSWEKQRIDKIAKATKILQTIASENNKSTNPFLSPTILYFAKQGCKYCTAEELIMNLFNKRYKNKVKITGMWVGSKDSIPQLSFHFHLSNGLEKKFRIGTYPTMIFYLPGKPGPVKLEGFVTGNQLIRFYQKIGGKL